MLSHKNPFRAWALVESGAGFEASARASGHRTQRLMAAQSDRSPGWCGWFLSSQAQFDEALPASALALRPAYGADEQLQGAAQYAIASESAGRCLEVPWLPRRRRCLRSLPELKRLCAEHVTDLIVADFWGASHLELDDHDRLEINELAAAIGALVNGTRAATGCSTSAQMS